MFVPPIENFFGWGDPANGRVASVDYAGLADEWINSESGGAISFGTEMRGTVTERPMADGRARVHVTLHTTNALTWVAADGDFNGTLLFGHRAPDVLGGGQEPALGSSFLHIDFINTAPGAPLPDMLQIAAFPEPGQEFFSFILMFHSNAAGELRAAFGVPEGTPGQAIVAQAGLFMTPFIGQGVQDGFPVERIELLETDGE